MRSVPLLFGLLPLLLGTTCRFPAEIVFDETHGALHSITDPEGYAPLADLLVAEGYRVSRWSALGDWASLSNDVDIIVFAAPTSPVTNELLLAYAKSWVEDGGVLFLIGDHQPHARNLAQLARMAGVAYRDTTIVHDGTSHCPPGVSRCLNGGFSFATSPAAGVLRDAPWVTTYAGTSFYALPGAVVNPVFRYTAPAHTLEGVDVAGEYQTGLVHLGKGMVVISSESGMWTCRHNPLPTGWCAESGVHNEQLARNVFALMSQVRPGAGLDP